MCFYAEPQRWRLICLGLGFLMLLLAPVVSSWVPFYYSSSMAIGILLVVIILLFQVRPATREGAVWKKQTILTVDVWWLTYICSNPIFLHCVRIFSVHSEYVFALAGFSYRQNLAFQFSACLLIFNVILCRGWSYYQQEERARSILPCMDQWWVSFYMKLLSWRFHPSLYSILQWIKCLSLELDLSFCINFQWWWMRFLSILGWVRRCIIRWVLSLVVFYKFFGMFYWHDHRHAWFSLKLLLPFFF